MKRNVHMDTLERTSSALCSGPSIDWRRLVHGLGCSRTSSVSGDALFPSFAPNVANVWNVRGDGAVDEIRAKRQLVSRSEAARVFGDLRSSRLRHRQRRSWQRPLAA